jgi:hypothetical protein
VWSWSSGSVWGDSNSASRQLRYQGQVGALCGLREHLHRQEQAAERRNQGKASIPMVPQELNREFPALLGAILLRRTG